MNWISLAWVVLNMLTFIIALAYFGCGSYKRALFFMFLGWFLMVLKVTGRLG